LSAPLQSLVEFLCIDQDLVETAAEISVPLDAEPSDEELVAWIRGLPETEKDNLLVTAVSGTGDWLKNELLHRFRRENQPVAHSKEALQPRTVGHLLSAARTLKKQELKGLQKNGLSKWRERKRRRKQYGHDIWNN
jgi:hypothetical protein